MENLHALTFSDIATSPETLRCQLQIITSSRSNILSIGTLEVILSPKSAIKQERRRVYRFVSLNFDHLKISSFFRIVRLLNQL